MVDRQNRPGARIGSVGVSSYEDANVERKERLRRLVLETIDISKDPYFMRNHIGTYECRLCLTLHSNEGSYMAHTQGKKHQTNLARRAAREARDTAIQPVTKTTAPKLRTIKIGKPIYRFKKQVTEEGQKQIMFEIEYPQIDPSIQPQHRFMSAYEQKVEVPDKNFRFLLFAAEPYVTIAFKVPSLELDQGEGKFIENWDPERKLFVMLLTFKD
jgi:splicing factor 3A subunit 2